MQSRYVRILPVNKFMIIILPLKNRNFFVFINVFHHCVIIKFLKNMMKIRKLKNLKINKNYIIYRENLKNATINYQMKLFQQQKIYIKKFINSLCNNKLLQKIRAKFNKSIKFQTFLLRINGKMPRGKIMQRNSRTS